MKIAIDLDGVVFNSEMFFMASAEIYDCMILNKNSVIQKEEPRVQNKYDWSKEELDGYIARYANATDFDIMPCAKTVLYEMKKENELFVISARGQFNEGEIRIARKKLDDAGIAFDRYFFGYLDKRAIILDQKTDILIDDRYDVCEQLSKDGVLCLYFRMAGRKKLPDSENIIEVHHWGDIYRILKDKRVI